MVSPGTPFRTNSDTIKGIQRENVKQWSRANDSFGLGSTSGIGGGGGGQLVPQTGSFLPLTGGALTGYIALSPILRAIIQADNSIDIDNNGLGTSRVIVSPINSVELKMIKGAKAGGQILFIQGIEGSAILIRNAVDETGNIETINEMDVALNSDDNLIFIFDSTDNKWQQVTPSHVQQIQIGAENALPIRYPLVDLGNIGSVTQSIDVDIEEGHQGYRMRLTGDIGIALNQTQSRTDLTEFFLVIRQDATGNHNIISSDGAITNATANEINQLLNKSPNSTTVFRLTSPGGSIWFIEDVGLGTVVGGSTPSDISFADLTGQIASTQIANNTIMDRHINDMNIAKLTSVAQDSGHILISGGGVTPNFWGTLNNVIGGIFPANISANSTNNGQILQVNNGEAEWDNFNLGELHDVESGSATVGNLLLRSSENGVVGWNYGKLTNDYINDNSLSFAKFSGVLPVDKVSSVNGSIGQVLGVASSGAGAVWVDPPAPALLSSIGDVLDGSPLAGNLLLRQNRAGGGVEWGFGKLTNTYIDDNTLSFAKFSGVLPVDKISSVNGSVGQVLGVPSSGAGAVWVDPPGPLFLSSVGDVLNATPTSGNLLLRSSSNQWTFGKLTDAYVDTISINDSTTGNLGVDRISSINGSPGQVLTVPSSGAGSTWTSLSFDSFSGNLPISRISSINGTPGQILAVASSGAGSVWIDPPSGGSVASLNDIGDVNTPNPASNAVLKRFGSNWVPGQVTNENISDVNAIKINAGTISTNRLPSTWVSALSGYQTSEGTIERRLDSLESSSGGGGSIDSLGQIGDVLSSTPTSGNLLLRSGNQWIYGKLTDTYVTSISASKITSGTISTNRLPTTIRTPLSGYQNSEGTIESRLDSLESAGGSVNTLGQIGDVLSATPSSGNLLLRSSSSQWTFGKLTDTYVSSISASKITSGTISTNRLPTIWRTALGGYQTSEGTIESRLDDLESSPSGLPNQASANNHFLKSNGNSAFWAPLDIALGGFQINGALNHDGSTIGFFGSAPQAKYPVTIPGLSGSASTSNISFTVNGILIALRRYGLINSTI